MSLLTIFIEPNEGDRFLSFLLISTLVLAGILLIFNVGDVGYLAKFPRRHVGIYVNTFVILCYWIKQSPPLKRYLNLHYVLFAFCVVLYLFHLKVNRLLHETPEQIETKMIAKVIREEKLHGGFGSFSMANATNFILNEQRVAFVRPAWQKPYFAEPCFWLIDKRVFSQKKYDFVLTRSNASRGLWALIDLTDAAIREQFGQPKKVIRCGSVSLYIYEGGISL